MQIKNASLQNPLGYFAMAGLLLVVAVPFVFIILQSIFPQLGSGSLANPFSHITALFNDPRLFRVTSNTVLLGLMVVALSALIAVPLAVFRALYKVPLAILWDILMLVPFMIPPYIATLGWIMSLQPRGYLEQLTGFNFSSFLFSVWGMTFVMALNTFPLVYFAVSRTIEAVGARYADVGRVFGASASRSFFRITLPLATPGLAASLLLVFAASIEEYGTPAALGRRSGFEVLVTEIDLRVSDWPIDLAGAAVFSLALVLLSLGAFMIQRWILNRRSYVTTGSKPQAKDKRALGKLAIPVVAFFAIVGFIASGVPLLAILATALSKTISGGLTFSNIGFDNFRAIAENSAGGMKALINSLSLGVASALFTGLLGAVAAYAVVKMRFRGRNFLDVLTVLPNSLPGVVVAVGLILAWNQPALLVSPYNTPLILLLAYCCILLPQPIRYTTAAFHQIGDSLEAAARVCGANSFTTFRRIMLPLIAPSLITAMLLVFAVASRELVASVLVAPVGMQTISIFIWRQFEQGSVGLGMAMALIAIIITTLLPLLCLALLKGKNFKL